MSQPNPTQEQVIAALQEILKSQPDPEGYYTSEEWADMLGVSGATVQKRLRVVLKAGRLGRAKVQREGLRGATTTFAYRILPKP